MNPLEKFRELVFGESGAVVMPPVQVSGVGTVTNPPEDPEQAARAAVHEAEDALADLNERRATVAGSLDGLRNRRAVLARELTTEVADEGSFTAACSRLTAAEAAIVALDELLGEAEASRREAQERLNEAERPRREAERRARVEMLRLAAVAAVADLYRSYRECCEATATVADKLEALAGLDQNAADNIHIPTINRATDPLLTLISAGWRYRAPGHYTVLERRLVPLVPPAGGVR